MAEWQIKADDGCHPVRLVADPDGDGIERLTVAQAMELVRSAPKMAGRWVNMSTRALTVLFRSGVDGNIVSDVEAGADGSGAKWRVCLHEDLHRWERATSIAAAKSAADAALRAAGFILDDGDA